MAETVRSSPRLGWLDGLRGLAAMQVVLQHYVFAFWPAVGGLFPFPTHDFWWRGLLSAPLVFLYNGHSAVYLFFIISGVALTHAFSTRPFAFLSTVTRRLIRLGLPMAAATVFAAALCSLLPAAHVVAAARTGSPWFEAIGPAEISVAAIAHQIAFEGLLVGFDGSSLVPGWMRGGLSLGQVGHGFDTPLWTLHIEFCGSLLVMLLTALRASATQTAYRVVCAILGCTFVLSPMLLFIVGHVIASHRGRFAIRTGRTSLGAAFLGLGILLCSIQTIPPLLMLWRFLPPPPLGIQSGAAILQETVGAMLIFLGLACLSILRRQLERPAILWLGKISFSLYLSHFALEFTCVAAGFTFLAGCLPYGFAVAVTAVMGIAASLVLATLFERCIDRPAITLSRIVGRSHRHVDPPVAYVPVAGQARTPLMTCAIRGGWYHGAPAAYSLASSDSGNPCPIIQRRK